MSAARSRRPKAHDVYCDPRSECSTVSPGAGRRRQRAISSASVTSSARRWSATDLPTLRGETLPRGRALGSGEVRALFAACSADGTTAGRRDAAMLALLYGAGLRRSELVALNREDYDTPTGALAVRRGKGRKERMVYATNGSAEALAAWLAVRGDQPGPLFWPIHRSGKPEARRMTAHAVLFVLRKRGDEAGVGAFSPHNLRRTFISDLLEAGADISTVQGLAGHANVQTTVRYDRRGEQAKRKAAALLHVPFQQERASES